MIRYVFILSVAILILATASFGASTRLAVGLAPLDRGLSIWYTGQRMWIGAELARFQLSSNKEVIPTHLRDEIHPEPPWGTVDRLTRRVHCSLVVQRFFSSDPFASFAYFRYYVNLNHEEWEYYYHNNWTDFGPELGIGFSWRPLSRASLMLRQGITLEAKHRSPTYRHRRDVSRYTLTVRLQETRLAVLFHF